MTAPTKEPAPPLTVIAVTLPLVSVPEHVPAIVPPAMEQLGPPPEYPLPLVTVSDEMEVDITAAVAVAVTAWVPRQIPDAEAAGTTD
jgi:hypothetical protein